MTKERGKKMLEDNKLEYIDKKYYSILNDFIRIGKREAKKWDDLNRFYDKKVKPYYEETLEALKKGYKTELFEIRVGKDFSNDKVIILYLPSLQKKYPLYIDINLTATNTKGMFDFIIKYFREKKYSQEAVDDLENLIDRVKKENSHIFLQYTRRNKTYQYLYDKVSKIHQAQFERMKKIRDMWDKDTIPQVGGPILYEDDYGNYHKGIVVKIKGKNNDIFTIRAGNNKIIERDRYDSSPYNAFYLTFLHECLIDILAGKVPECWKENRVDFYA